MNPSTSTAINGPAQARYAPCPVGTNPAPEWPRSAATLALNFARADATPPLALRGPTAMAARPATAPAAGCLQGVIDALDVGVLVCDERGRLLLRNAAAARELADGGVLRLTADGALDVCGGVGLLLLRRAVHAASLAGAYQLVPLRQGGRQLMVSVQPVRTADGGPPSALLLLGRRQLCPELAVQELGRLYDLTAAERTVLASLLAGVAVGAMARLRGVAVSTVRSQVAALRAKFGVRRIDDITRLVAELPPMLGALPGLGSGQGAGGAGGIGALHR